MTIDSPSGVGFSKLTTESCIDSYCSIIDVYTFLNKFFLAHSQYQGRDFYITGQSYAGHYIPLLAEHIIKQSNSMINLKGIAIGNGWYNGINQMSSFSSFAFKNNLISWWKYLFSNLVIFVSDILLKAGIINLGGYLGDPYVVNLIAGERFSIYDIRRKEYPDYETNIINYFKLPEVIERLNISDRPYFANEVNDICNSSIEFTYADDFDPMDSSLRTIINSNIKVLLFTGDKDFICNLDSQEMWLSKFEWEGQSHIVNDAYTDWKLDDTLYGKYKKYKNLMHLVIYNASHMSSIEQPYCTNTMINQFIDGQIGL
jgi:carboxypeptidase C (cathepsin A)